MSKIIYINFKQLGDPRLQEFLHSYDYDWSRVIRMPVVNPGMDSIYVRKGINVMPFKNDLVQVLGMQMPEYDADFDLSFSDVTDQRCLDLRQRKFDKPWLIQWSGGIDSQVIVCSILKNLSPADRSNIHIACNRISIYESPQFYYQYIKPNFQIVDSNNLRLDEDLLKHYYVISGDPADQLYGGVASKSMQDDNIIFRNWQTDPDGLINIYSQYSDRSWAEWYYELQRQSVESVDVPIENYYDFCWWSFFNLSWLTILLRPLNYQTRMTIDNFHLYRDSFIPWYESADYQRWAMIAKHGVKYDNLISLRKLASKQYIYAFNHDEYYYTFKTKMESMSRTPPNWGGYFCLLDDFTRLRLDHDLDTILELLPDHVNL